MKIRLKSQPFLTIRLVASFVDLARAVRFVCTAGMADSGSEEGWDVFFQEEFKTSQDSLADLEEAEELRESSDTESDAPVTHGAQPFWVEMIKEGSAHLGAQPTQSSPFHIISGCTGCCAEAEVFKARLYPRLTVHDTSVSRVLLCWFKFWLLHPSLKL